MLWHLLPNKSPFQKKQFASSLATSVCTSLYEQVEPSKKTDRDGAAIRMKTEAWIGMKIKAIKDGGILK